MANRFSVEAIFKAVDKISAPVSRMQNRLQKFTRSIDSGLKRTTKAFSKFTRTVGKTVFALGSLTKKAAGFGLNLAAGATVATGGFVTLLNFMTKADVEAQKLAKSIGFNVSELQALSKVVEGAGFNFDNVVDLIEEMNNKLGESSGLEEITPVKESLEILGLSFEKIKNLAPEKQFKAITNAALAMDDAQKAASASDILLGGEANKIIGVLRQEGKTIDDIVKKYKDMTFRTDQSRLGAVQFQKQLKLVTTAFSSVSMEIAGLLAGALTPLIKKMGEWVKANRELIETNIKKFVNEIVTGVKLFIGWIAKLNNEKPVFDRIKDAVNTISSAISLLVKNSAKIQKIVTITGALIGGFIALKGAIIAINIVSMMNPWVAALTGVAALLSTIVIFWDDIKNAINGAWEAVKNFVNSGIGSFLSKIGFGGGNITSNNNVINKQNPQAANQNFSPNIVSPEQRNMSMIQSIEKNQTEITIKDDTGRAEVTKGQRNQSNIKLQNTGSF